MIKHLKGLSLLIVMLTSSVAHSQQTTNAIYIEQIGDSSDISVTQLGEGNQVGNIENPFLIYGDNQWITIQQQGPRNILNGRIVQADNVWAHIMQNGFDNTAQVDLGQVGDVSGSYFDLHVQGDGNITNFTQGGVTSAMNGSTLYYITGALNTINAYVETNDAINEAIVTGNFNNITTSQSGYNGKESIISVDGNNNNIQVTQSSTLNVDSLHLNSVGSGTNITVNQCNSGVC